MGPDVVRGHAVGVRVQVGRDHSQHSGLSLLQRYQHLSTPHIDRVLDKVLFIKDRLSYIYIEIKRERDG